MRCMHRKNDGHVTKFAYKTILQSRSRRHETKIECDYLMSSICIDKPVNYLVTISHVYNNISRLL